MTTGLLYVRTTTANLSKLLLAGNQIKTMFLWIPSTQKTHIKIVSVRVTDITSLSLLSMRNDRVIYNNNPTCSQLDLRLCDQKRYLHLHHPHRLYLPSTPYTRGHISIIVTTYYPTDTTTCTYMHKQLHTRLIDDKPERSLPQPIALHHNPVLPSCCLTCR